MNDAQRAAWIHRTLVAWYRAQARDLPWRRTRDPYRVWLSEVMLQQTRVAAVKPYYRRWLQAFPDVAALAAASEEQVLKHWEGLGYYRRARNLHRAARTVVRERGGRMPGSASDWQCLPGVGRYTAGAVASITCGEAVAAVDGNGKRVLARLERIEAPIDAPSVTARLWQRAQTLVAAEKGMAGDFNQALMELGARICVPRRPLCAQCPLETTCFGRAAGVEASLPLRRARRAVPEAVWVVALIVRGGRYLMAQRPPGLLGGLWEFPSTTREPGEDDRVALERLLREDLATAGVAAGTMLSVEHAFTHLRVTLRLAPVTLSGAAPRALRHVALRWARRGERDRLASSVAMRKLFRALDRVRGHTRPTPE